jgi:hypothetical protein
MNSLNHRASFSRRILPSNPTLPKNRDIFGRSQKFDDKHSRKREKYVKQEIARTREDCAAKIGAPMKIVTIVARDRYRGATPSASAVTLEENDF